VLKRCCGTGAIHDEQLEDMISNVEAGEISTTNLLEEKSKLQQSLGEVNMEVLKLLLDRYAETNASRIFGDDDELSKYLKASYKILNTLDWKKVMPKMVQLNWKDAKVIVPADAKTSANLEDLTDGGIPGELKSIAGFSIKFLHLSVPFQEKLSERQITQDEINDIILRTKKGDDLTETQQKQVKILNDLNTFVWQQKPRDEGTYPALEARYEKFLTWFRSPKQGSIQFALMNFRTKYKRAKPQRDALLEKNKEEFRQENASHLLTDALAERVMKLVAAKVAATAQSQAPP